MAGESFIWGAQGKKMSPEEVARQRAVAALLTEGAVDTSPVGHWSAGAARLVNAFSGVRKERQASAAEEQGRSGAKSVIDALLGGGNVSMSSSGAPASPGSMPVVDGGVGFAGQTPSAPVGDIAQRLRMGMIERGLPEHVADGFLMNFQDESGLNPGINEQNPTVPGSRGGFGLYQLTGPRRVAYEQFAQRRGVSPADPDAQLDFLMTELQGPESRAAQSIMAAPDAGTAAAAIARDFLRPAPEHLQRRVAQYTGGQGVSASSMGGGTPQGTSPVMQALLQASTDPWVAQEYGPVLQALMGQEQSRQQFAMEQADPMRQLQMQKAQLEIEQMRNPTATLPASVQEIQWKAQALGLQPGSQEYNDFIMTGGSDGVPAEVQALQWRAQQAGLEPGTQEYQDFIMNGGARGTGVPAGFAALDAQAKAGGLEPGTPEYQQFMIGGGAGQRAAATATGKMQAEAQIALPSTIATAERALANIEAIRNDPALPGITGMVQGRIPPMSPAGTDLNVRINQAKGQTFLEAFESLKGAGQITEIEGQKAEQAIARLDRAQSTEAYQQALDDLADVLRSGMERARTKAGVQPPAPPMGGIMAAPPESAAVENVGPPVKRMRFDPVTGMFE